MAPASALVSTNAAASPPVQWRVRDVQAATVEVSVWVAARQGQVVATDARHFSVTLPASAVPEFLQRFSSAAGKAGWMAASTEETFPLTLQLELVPSE